MLLQKSKKQIRDVLHSVLNLVYPPLCFHCENKTDGKPLCPACLHQLELVDVARRCHQCFAPDINPSQKYCTKCIGEDPSIDGVVAAFDYIGPIVTLIHNFKYGNKYWLSDGLAGFMAAQYLKLDWPMPDMIVPVPMAWNRYATRGYNQSQLLAESLGKLLDIPVKPILKRRCGDYSQAALSKEQRLQLQQNISLKDERLAYDQVILLVDDVITTGSTLKRSAEALIEGCPAKIFALSLAHTT